MLRALPKLILIAICITATAQEPAPYTLHVYTNLIQIPTLVINSQNDLLPPIPPEQFALRLDAGPSFHPTQTRMQGDDPIALSVLLDAGADEKNLIAVFDTAFASLAPGFLTSHDTFTILAADCVVIRTNKPLQPDPTTLRQAVVQVLATPALHNPPVNTPCRYRNHVWDALAVVLRDIVSRPGRRVILVVTSGDDHGSATKWRDLASYANKRSIAIFATQNYSIHNARGFAPTTPTEDPLRLLCTFTGGVILPTSPKELPKTLQHFTSLLRGRYILEFPRPANGTPGLHQLDIRVPREDAYIVSSGTTALLPDDAELLDPNTVPPDPTRAPTQGTRRIATQH